MSSYTTFAQPAAPATLAADNAGYTFGMQFKLRHDCSLTGIWFYSAPGATGLPNWCGIYLRSTNGLVVEKPMGTPTWSGAAGSGWVKCTFDGTVTLSAGIDYKVAVGVNPAPGNWYASSTGYWGTGGGTNGVSRGPISAPNNAGVTEGQDSFNTSVPAWPGSSFNASNYWLDVEVSKTSSHLQSAVLGLSPGLFYENDETVSIAPAFYDSSPNLRDGSAVGTPTIGNASLLTDGIGKSWSPGAGSNYIKRAGEAWMNPSSGGVSVFQVFKLSALPPSLGTLFARDDASGLSRHWVLYVTSAGGLRFIGTSTTVSNVDQSSTGLTLTVGTIYALAMVWDYSLTNVKIYLQPAGGSASNPFTVTGFTGVETSDTSRPFTVGDLDNRSDLAWYHRGDIKATAFFPSVLSAANFSTLADAAFQAAGSGGPSASGLLLASGVPL